MRRASFAMVHRAQLGYPSGDFSAIDIPVTLYLAVMRHDPNRNCLPGVETNTGPLAMAFLWRRALR